MTFKLMKQLLLDPVVAINSAKRMRDYHELLLLLVIEWALVGIGLAVTLRTFGTSAALGIGAMAALLGIALTIFGGFLIQLVFHILGGRGTYWTGLTSAVYAKFPLAFGVFLGAILFSIPVFGLLVGVLLITLTSLMSISIFYRTLKELFQVDIVTTWVGIGILVAGIIVSLYISIILLSPGAPTLLSFLRLR